MMWNKVVVVLMLSATANAQTLKSIATINISKELLKNNPAIATTEYLTAKKQSLGKFAAANVYETVRKSLEDLGLRDAGNIVFVAESDKGSMQTFTLADIRPDVVKLPAMILLEKITERVGDTVKLAATSTRVIDEQALEQEFAGKILHRIYLQIPTAANSLKQYFQPYSIIFPTDSKTSRWLANIRFLHVCTIEKENDL